MSKKILAFILAAALVFGSMSSLPAGVFAANEETQEAMTEVLLKVKTRLELPDEYTVFNYNYNNYGTREYWNFNWSTEDGTKSVYANADKDGHIMNVSYYDQKTDSAMPDKTAEDVQPDAEKLLKMMFPEVVGHVVLKNTYCTYYRSAYTFCYDRIENGVEMPDNYVRIMVRYTDAEPVSAQINWNYTSDVPAADKLIGKEAAQKKIGKEVNMILQYHTGYDNEGNEKIFLAYTPSISYIAVDARSGKIYKEKNYWSDASKEADNGMAEEAADDAESNGSRYVATLSDAEMKKIAELNDLISSDDAVRIIRENQYLLVDANATTVSASLSQYREKYTWRITIRDNRPVDYNSNDYYRAYSSATIDAESGRILSYYSSLKTMYDYMEEERDSIKLNYSKKQCRNIFESFLKSVDEDRFKTVKLSSTDQECVINEDGIGNYTYGAYAFNYTRYHEDIPFVNNGIHGSVDRITGKVYSYSVNWTDGEVPSSKGVIGAEKAFESYMSYDGFDLIYEIVTTTKYNVSSSLYGSEQSESIRLVYRTAIYPSFVDAFTGKQLTYSGEEYQNVRTDYTYNDITGHKYEKAIKILAGMNVGLPGESFEPDRNITKDEFATLLKAMPVLGYYSEESGLSGDGNINRQAAAKGIIDTMGLETIAKLDIYKLKFSDASKVSKGYRGYVALAAGLNLFGNSGDKKFGPKTLLTRGEAAQLLLNAASVR